MKTNMTLIDVVRAKRKLRVDIGDMLRRFEEETGVYVTDIVMERIFVGTIDHPDATTIKSIDIRVQL